MLKKYICAALALSLVLGGVTRPADTFAQTSAVLAEVNLFDIKLIVDGSPAVLVDANGKFGEPAVVNGVLCAPIASLARVMGKEYRYDDENRVAVLWSGGETEGFSRSLQQGNIERLTTDLIFNDVRIFLDGDAFPIMDEYGNIVEPFILFQTFYVPLPPFVSALGGTSHYSSATRTIIITTPAATPRPTVTSTPAPTPTPTPAPPPPRARLSI